MHSLQTEKTIFSQGNSLLGAIDEAGRGPLAGPVVAACVVLKKNTSLDALSQVKDSKKLTEKKREELYNVIRETFEQVGVGLCDNQTIDRINILQASFLAMKKAVSSLKIKPDRVILDGQYKIPNFSINQTAIIKGDSLVLSIAAASIIAKVSRDRIMKDMHKQYPEYGFDKHKGYGTKEHIESIYKFGPSDIHRRSFNPIKKLLS